jgi:hypothetical protein
MTKCHYDKYLSGITACKRVDYDLASEDIKQVTCKSCLKAASARTSCDYPGCKEPVSFIRPIAQKG